MIATSGIAPQRRMPGEAPKRPVAARSRSGGHPRITRLSRGLLSLALYVALVGGIATAAGSALAYWRGHAAGVEQAEQQAASDRAAEERRHRAEQDRLRADAQAKFDAALAAAAERYDRIDTARKEAQHALAVETARTARLRGDLAAAVRDRDRMRGAIAAAASGGLTEAEDSTAACRARADALGRVLGEALSAHRQCSLDAEDLAAGVRALRAWAGAVEAGERAGEVAAP